MRRVSRQGPNPAAQHQAPPRAATRKKGGTQPPAHDPDPAQHRLPVLLSGLPLDGTRDMRYATASPHPGPRRGATRRISTRFIR